MKRGPANWLTYSLKSVEGKKIRLMKNNQRGTKKAKTAIGLAGLSSAMNKQNAIKPRRIPKMYTERSKMPAFDFHVSISKR